MKQREAIKMIFNKSLRLIKRESHTILTGLSIIGVVATSIMVAKATAKSVELLQEASKDKEEDLTNTEIILMVGREYIPSVILGTSTIACLIGANILNRKQQASLISAYALIDESFKKYKKATKTVYGDDADTKIKSEIAKSTYVSCTGHSLYSPDLDYSDDKMLFYDMISSRYFRASIPAVINAQYHINRNLQLRGYVSINEFYEFIGIEQIDGGDDVGWNIDELISDNIMWLDFNNDYTVMDDGLECCIISAIYEPILLFDT